jgi:hypothetical protein
MPNDVLLYHRSIDLPRRDLPAHVCHFNASCLMPHQTLRPSNRLMMSTISSRGVTLQSFCAAPNQSLLGPPRPAANSRSPSIVKSDQSFSLGSIIESIHIPQQPFQSHSPGCWFLLSFGQQHDHTRASYARDIFTQHRLATFSPSPLSSPYRNSPANSYHSAPRDLLLWTIDTVTERIDKKLSNLVEELKKEPAEHFVVDSKQAGPHLVLEIRVDIKSEVTKSVR